MSKCIMIQGTMSNAGKSILVGGLCRVFAQDGYRTAPFKSQNMALNSFITKEGLEMGRAQVMQAEAAGIEPSVLMNPILLKPTNDTGSQVIVNGEVTGVMSASEYYRSKKKFVPAVLDAYHELEKSYDIIVIEGAGSPAEINLKDEDIVNMGLAELVDAPVLLVGDIDRGGVFAQLVGTVMLLEEQERNRIKGTIINKFRGDKNILAPGLQMLEEKTGIPVRGVVPYFYLDIDDEDSLTERFDRKETAGLVDIAVIRLPRISNFTDFMALECMEGVSVRYVSAPGEFGNPDAVLIPGSKNTIGDLLWMRQNGLEAKVIRHSGQGKLVFGICGGYQMLGEEITDPEGVEQKGTIQGMGLLPARTVFEQEKTRTRVQGTFLSPGGMLDDLNGVQIEGYEIHMGATELTGGSPILTLRNDVTEESQKMDGAAHGNVYGCYVHGVFDKPEAAGGLVRALLKQKGLDHEDIRAVDLEEYKNQQYDKLADIIRESLDMDAVYRILEGGE
ncbi:cobyric acid synthase [Faecalicatena orotica]|uniref:Cobyric acid synthase n=1 Tax=Faecalicatena orotica TaxID=1544 RepID=A0A2Y9CAB2_9FIRM|nr:cobyric acid synthase [Faecalicatena orotica]PWJ28368.1 adenosylcobyric acid synthase (glutamine-hydrolysing) [Faecalicatena orotica]SSA56824.1 adenosylcobyric acid synthase (glutamine-hydrolysing) [Faecalicatena orotica]